MRLGHLSPILFQPDLFLSIVTFTLAMGGSFVINQVYDVDTDTMNKKLFLLGEGFISIKNGFRFALFLLTLSMLLPLFFNVSLFLPVAAFNLVTGYLYNVRPFALKNKPVWGVVANMAMGWLAFAMGWLACADFASLISVSLPFLFFNTSLYFLTTLPDTRGDAGTGKITFPVKFGKEWTIAWCLFFFIIAFIISLWHKNEFIFVVSILTFPFMLRLYLQKSEAAALVAVKAGIALFSLAVCIKFPLLFILLTFIFFTARFYYKHRFNYNYPNFKGS